MDKMELMYAFGEISDKYILEAARPKKRKLGKRIAAIFAAAAILLIGALGAAAYYYNNEDVRNGMKWLFGESKDSDADLLDGMISHEGKLTQNSFDELDIAFSGAICDNDELYAIFTVTKKDGTPFTQPEGYGWYAGFTDTSHYRFGKAFRTVRSDRNFHAQLGEDGALSVAVRGTEVYEPGQKKFDYSFAFTNLYCVPEHDALEAQNDDFAEINSLANEAISIYESRTQEGFERAAQRYFTAMQSISVQSMEGSAQCVVDSGSLKAVIPSYEFEYRGLAVKMDISPIKIKVYARGGGWDHESYYTGQTVGLIYKDGTRDELECTDRSFGGNYDESSWELIYPDDKPIDPSVIDHIVFDGIRIDIK